MRPLFKDVDYGWGELEPLINSSQFDGNGHFLDLNSRVGNIDWFKLPEPVSEDSQIKMYEQDVWE